MSDETDFVSPAVGLNAAQRGVVASNEQDATSPDWIMSVAATVRPAVDAATFAEATRRMFADLDGARVLVAPVDGHWRQWVDDTLPRELVVHDVREADEPEQAADALVDTLRRHPMALDGTQPLVAVHLVQVSAEESRWLVLGHHVASDGVSGDLVRRRLAAWYDHLRGKGPTPPAPTTTMAQAWQVADADRTDTTVADWAATLADSPARVTLATRPTTVLGAPVRATVHLPADDVAALLEAARCARWTQPVVALAAAYTARFTGERDTILGLTLAGRAAPAQRDVVTMLARNVPLRLADPCALTLAEGAHTARAALVRAHRLGPVTAEELLSAVPSAWRTGRVHGPIVNLVPFDTEIPLAGHSVHSIVLNRGPVVDLQLAVSPRDGGIDLDAVANGAAYTHDEVARHLERIAHLARLATAHPDMPLGELDPSLPAEVELRDDVAVCMGQRVVDADGRPALIDAVGTLVDDRAGDTGHLARVCADGTVEDLGPAAETRVLGGIPVSLTRVRRAAATAPGARVTGARFEGRRIVVEVATEPDAGLRARIAMALEHVVPRVSQVRVVAAAVAVEQDVVTA